MPGVAWFHPPGASCPGLRCHSWPVVLLVDATSSAKRSRVWLQPCLHWARWRSAPAISLATSNSGAVHAWKTTSRGTSQMRVSKRSRRVGASVTLLVLSGIAFYLCLLLLQLPTHNYPTG